MVGDHTDSYNPAPDAVGYQGVQGGELPDDEADDSTTMKQLTLLQTFTLLLYRRFVMFWVKININSS